MCPACIATAAVIAVRATSTGGLTASIVTKYGSKNVANKVCTQTKSRGEGRAIPQALLRRSGRINQLVKLGIFPLIVKVARI